MIRSDVADLRVRRRLAQIEERLSELRARSFESSGVASANGPDHERLARAASRASQARTHAAEAARRALAAYRRSAEVHELAADLYDQLATGGAGDTTWYQQRADRHRKLAVQDRAACRRPGHGGGYGPAQRAGERGEHPTAP